LAAGAGFGRNARGAGKRRHIIQVSVSEDTPTPLHRLEEPLHGLALPKRVEKALVPNIRKLIKHEHDESVLEDLPIGTLLSVEEFEASRVAEPKPVQPLRTWLLSI
jgi:hypothetical protein